MNHFTLPRRAAWLALFALGMLAALAGCSKRVTSVDAGYTTLDGRMNANSRLLAWRDAPVSIIVWADLGPPGPDFIDADVKYDTLIGRLDTSWGKPGVLQMAVLDNTPASGFQFYRRADNGGLQALTDYAIPAAAKWLSTGWEMYGFADQHPSSYSPATYVGRGLLDGKVTTSSPLTNDALPDGAAPKASTIFHWAFHPADSSYTWNWTLTPGAAGYWLDVYQFTGHATAFDLFASGAPNPVLVGSYVTHRVLEYWPASLFASPGQTGRMSVKTFAGMGPGGAQASLRAPATSSTSAQSLAPRLAGSLGPGMSMAALAGPVKPEALAGLRVTGPVGMDALGGAMNMAAPTGARAASSLGPDVLQESLLYRGQTYLVRVTAVDAHGKVLSWMTGDYGFQQETGYYYYIPLGAAVITVPAK